MHTLKKLSDCIRFLSVDMVNAANSGHPGAPLGMADIATVLFKNHLKFDPQNPDWLNRDRFILSNGHASALLYSLLHLTGYKDCTLDQLKKFRQVGSKTAGHPEYGFLKGIETTTGPLGQGLANAVGMAIGQKLLRAKESQIDHKIYTFVGDGCLEEGISYEATSLAGHQKLDNLIVLWDNNSITIDGPTSLSRSENMKKRFESIGWKVLSCDGHNFKQIDSVLKKAQKSKKPVFIDCKTVIAKGCKALEGSSAAHGAPIGNEKREQMSRDLNWNLPPFELPQELLNAWRKIGKQHAAKQFDKSKTIKSFQTEKTLSKNDLKNLEKVKKEKLKSDGEATRKTLQAFLNNVNLPWAVGGSADLTPSNHTESKSAKKLSAHTIGNYIHYGIREHAMGAVMNGLALYGFIPFGGTFLSFLDYMKAPVRLSSLMAVPSKFIYTHDSFWLGEDGPTHQPIEHIESLRMIPNFQTFRPCDAVEVIECCELMFGDSKNPSALLLSRQGLPILRKDIKKNLSAKGGYIIDDCEGTPDLILIGTGSEVSLAKEIKEKLNKKVRIVSMPCREIFDQQSQSYKDKILPATIKKIAIEAGSPNGWYRYADEVFGVETFGHSGKGKDIAAKLGFTADELIKRIN